MNGDEQKELAEYVIKKILDGMVFFIAEESLIEIFEDRNPDKFERTGKEVKIRGSEGLHKLYFIKNNDSFKKHASTIVMGAGANFETLMGIFFDFGESANCHVYHIGRRFDLDKLSEMVYSLFTESAVNKIKETCRRKIYCPGKNKKELIKAIACSNTFVPVADISYLNALQFPDSEMSVNAKIAKELNKPVILVIDRSLPQEGKLRIKRFFSGYNVIKEIECDLNDKSQWLAAKEEIGKLTVDVVDNKVLTRTDFIRIDSDPVHYYYSFQSDDAEICLEPCAAGFDVAIYNGDAEGPEIKSAVEPKRCTKTGDYTQISDLFGDRKDGDWIKALEIANDLYQRIVIPECKKHAVKFTNDLYENKNRGD